MVLSICVLIFVIVYFNSVFFFFLVMYGSVIGYPRSFILGIKDVIKPDTIESQLLNFDVI